MGSFGCHLFLLSSSLSPYDRFKVCFFGKSLVVWHLHSAEWGLWYTLIFFFFSFFRFEIFFFYGMFSSTLYDVCFLYGPTHWTVVLLNFLLAHSWSVCLLLTSSGKCHTIHGDIPVWHEHPINDKLWFYPKFCQLKESSFGSLIPLLSLLCDPQTWLEVSHS